MQQRVQSSVGSCVWPEIFHFSCLTQSSCGWHILFSHSLLITRCSCQPRNFVHCYLPCTVLQSVLCPCLPHRKWMRECFALRKIFPGSREPGFAFLFTRHISYCHHSTGWCSPVCIRVSHSSCTPGSYPQAVGGLGNSDLRAATSILCSLSWT